MAENKKIIISVEVKESGAKLNKTAAATENLASKVTILNKEQRQQIINDEKSAIQKRNLIASLKSQAAAEMNAANATGALRAQSGLNNAILLETSRLASDASYGLQGMANNIGQLLSLFQSYSRTAGGFMASIKELGKSLIGSGGLLILLQLLISFSPKIVKAFKKSKSAIEEETEALKKNTKEVERNLAKRKILSGQAEELADSFSVDFIRNFQNGLQLLDSTDVALEELFERFSEFGVENAEIIKDETIANDARLEIAFRLLDVFRQETEIKNIRLKQDKELQEAAEKGREINQIALAQFAQDIIQRRFEIRSLNEEIERLRKRGIVLTPEEDDDDGGAGRRFKRQFLRFTEEIFRARKIIRDTLTSDREAELREIAFLEKEKIRVERDAFMERQQQRLKDGLITEKQFNETRIQAAEELQTALVAIDKKTNTLIQDFRVNQLKIAFEQESKNYSERNKLQLENALIYEQIEGKRAGARLKLDKIILDSRIEANRLLLESDTLNQVERAKLQSEITKDEQKQTAIRMQIADAEANAKIQSYDLIASGLSALTNIVGRETEAGRALAVTSTLISTYTAAQKAYESQFLPIPTTSSPVRAELARAVAILQGLGAVKSILSAGKGTPSTAKGTINVEAPDFNVVGASPESQLAQSVATSQQQPLRAFVVGKDITNQQEFDRNLVTNAGLGD